MRIAFFFSALLFIASAALARENELVELTSPKVVPPEAIVSAVAEKWKIQNLAERLSKPGETGCTDAFWELLTLCEEKEEARKDKDVVALFEWMVLESKLISEQSLGDPIYIRIPKLMPELGRKFIEKRISTWLGQNDGTQGPNAPWNWPEYLKIDRAVLLAALKNVYATGPKHNPTVRFWLACGLLATGDPDGEKAFAETRENLLKKFETQGEQKVRTALAGMVTTGVKEALLIYAREGRTAPGQNFSASGMSQQQVLSQLTYSLGWSNSNRGYSYVRNDTSIDEQYRVMIEWLSANLNTLTWDSRRRVFVSEVPPPGREKLFKIARAVKAKHGFDVLAETETDNQRVLPNVLFNWVSKNEAALADPQVAELLGEILMMPQHRYWLTNETGAAQLESLPATAEPFKILVWSRVLSARLDDTKTEPQNLELVQRNEHDATIAKALHSLAPVYEQKLAEAVKAGKDEDSLQAMMRVLICGGKLDKQIAVPLIARAPVGWTTREGRLYRWYNVLLQARRTSSLTLLLYWGGAQIKEYSKDRNNRYSHPLGQFISHLGWNVGSDVPDLAGPELLALCETWLEKNEAALSYDQNNGRFGGALSPQRQEVLAALEPLAAKYKLNLSALAKPSRDSSNLREIVRGLCTDLAAVIEKDEVTAKDPVVARAIDVMLSHLSEGENLERNLLPAFTRTDSVKIREHVLQSIRKSVDASRAGRNVYSIGNAYRNLQGIHAPLLQSVQNEIAQEVEKRAAGSGPERLMQAFILAALNQPVNKERFTKLVEDFGPAIFEQNGGVDGLQAIARMGNVGVHRMYLVAARQLTERRYSLLSQFESQVLGLQRRNNYNTPEALDAALTHYENWLDANEAKIVWNRDKQKFEGPKPDMQVERINAPEAAPKAPKAVRPPAPPPPEF